MALPATSEPPGPTPLAPALREGGPPPGPARPALYHQTWFLATVSAVVVAGVVGVAVLAAGDKPARPSWGQVGGDVASAGGDRRRVLCVAAGCRGHGAGMTCTLP